MRKKPFDVISYEHTPLSYKKPKYSFQFFEIKAQHDVIALLPGFIILGLGVVIFLKSKKENQGTQPSKL